jgi:glycosyltransferase involved in cell wall biosynthesis
MTTTIIIPTYNEARVIKNCLTSLFLQTKQSEIIVVDDGSTDETVAIIKSLFSQHNDTQLFTQNHRGPGAARNFGASKAHGEILVLIDADMTFDKDFVKYLITPIEKKQCNGTFTKDEYVANWENWCARAWNYNQNIPDNRRIPQNYPDKSPVFRAILAKEFQLVQGFDENVGWTDDWTLSKKLGYQATATVGTCYHTNPASLSEVFAQAQWIGKNNFLTKSTFHILFNLVRYSFLFSLFIGLSKSIKYKSAKFIGFKIIYDFGISLSLIMSLFGIHKNK